MWEEIRPANDRFRGAISMQAESQRYLCPGAPWASIDVYIAATRVLVCTARHVAGYRAHQLNSAALDLQSRIIVELIVAGFDQSHHSSLAH